MNNIAKLKVTEYLKLLFHNVNHRTRFEEKTLFEWFRLLDEIEKGNYQLIVDRLRFFHASNGDQLVRFLNLLPQETGNILIQFPDKAYPSDAHKEQVRAINEATGKSVIAIYRSGIEGIPELSDDKRIFVDNEFDLKAIYEEVNQK